ncbi:nucleolar protein 6 isoform X2 [Triplophysa rosa]|uniref:nucleolar protein 6 isoform X2 n=1 Tax=Triplophysa rosa TaxID=992332 RepID=UPI00254636F6|nr:nucleolar protein 6 isoform X2 [Triplophysa rosa]
MKKMRKKSVLPEAQDYKMESPDPSQIEEQDEKSVKVTKGPKRQAESTVSDNGVLQPLKMSKQELYKAPTVEEFNQLKEAENLFHCNLLKMQMDELLKEVALSEHRKNLLDFFVQQITHLLHTVPKSEVVELEDLSWLSGVEVPIRFIPKVAKGKFHMEPPESINLVGSYPLGTCIKPQVSVDLAVTIPATILHPMDAINQKYPQKRALYLAGLVQHLMSTKTVGSLRYSCLHGNRLRPLLLIKPRGKDSSSVTLRVHAVPPPNFLKPSRFHPQKNNVRTEWFTGVADKQQELSEPPTPHYNSTILGDHLPLSHFQFLSANSTQCPAFRDVVALLKVWLRQRGLDQGAGCFCGFHASMLLAYLLSTHKVGKSMNAYQLFRNVLHFLASTDLTKNGITLAKNADTKAPSIPEFHMAFSVVFVDPSGHLNLCADMTTFTYKQIQHEALLSIKIWDDPTVDCFQALFMTTKAMIRTYDNVFYLSELVKLQASCKKLSLLNELMDHSGNYVLAAFPFILSLLQQGLGERIHLLAHSLPPDPEWSVDSAPPKHKNQPPLCVGLLLNLQHALCSLERGPPADSPKATEFRQMWGSRSELRRFQDGAITEAVLWSGSSVCQKRLILREIIAHLLQLHADIPGSCVRFVGQLDSLITVDKEDSTTGEEESLKVIQAYEDLSRKLWQLEGLPLSITSVQGAHQVIRCTQVFPPVPVKLDYSFFVGEKNPVGLMPKADKPCPYYITPIKVIVHMEGSGKWPSDHLAIHHIKAAFHVCLGELLNKHHKYRYHAKPTYLDVWKDGLAFRIHVAYHREPQILREALTPEGMLIYRDNPEAQSLELETQHKPYLTSTLHGLQQQHGCFGAVSRLSKRWLASQFLLEDIQEEPADLLVASLFLHSAPFDPPSSPQVGFLRFLYVLSTFDWRNNPLVVNLNQKLTAADYAELKNDFVVSRESLPAMFIATPNDKTVSVWTKEAPSVQMLQHAVMLAAKSLQVVQAQLVDSSLKQDIRVVFRPSLEAFDVLIHLVPKQVPLLAKAVDPPLVTFQQGVFKGSATTERALPIIDYDPVRLYLSELREAFGDLALFFYDPFGGTVIAVLWKPKAFESQSFKTTLMNARRVEVYNDVVSTVPNVEAILQDFHLIGEGLVKTVELRTEKWVI